MGTALVDGLDTASRKDEGDSFLEFRNVDAFLLEVWILTNHAGRVELGSTSSVGVASTHN